MRQILVTGGTGFLGKKVAMRFKEAGDTVYVLGRNVSLRPFFEERNIHFIHSDITEPCVEKLDDLDIVVHCAALASPWGTFESFYNANVLGTKHVLDLALVTNTKRVVHISSPSIYNTNTHRENLTESSQFAKKSVNAYAKTKLMAEQMLMTYAANLPYVILRPKGIIGPGDTSIMPRIMRAVKHNKMILVDNGEALVDMTYIDNVVDAILAAADITKKGIVGHSFNITNGEPMMIKELLQHVFNKLNIEIEFKSVPYWAAFMKAILDEGICKAACREPIFTRYSVNAISKTQTFNIEKAKTLLGYKPTVSLIEGVQRYVNWVKESENKSV